MSDKDFMAAAIELAREASENDEVPVGAVVVRDGKIIGKGKNEREKGKNALAHAELEAINEACRKTGSWRLDECELYVTLEPCPMCAGAIINSRLKRVFFGAYDEKAGACVSLLNMFEQPFNHRPQVIGGYLENECKSLLSDFFERIRKSKAADNRA